MATTRSRKLRSVLIIALLGLTSGAVVISLLLTLLLSALLPRFVCAPHGIRCTVGQANFSPHLSLTADLVVHHLTLFDPDGRGVALQIKRLAVTLDLPALILTRQVMPTEVRIDGPEVRLKQLDDGRWNLLALAQRVRQHLPPTTRPTQLQLPRTSVTTGALQISGHRVTDVYVSIEPKPAPLLFGIQARAALGGRSVQASGLLTEGLEGDVQAQADPIMLRGASRPLKPHALLRFRLDSRSRAVTISEWSLEADGAIARGSAALRYADWPPAYTLTAMQWRADLAALAQTLPAPWRSVLTGMVEGEPFTLQGHWPDLPVGEVTARLTGGGLQLPTQPLAVTGLSGRISFSWPDGGRRWKAELMSRSLTLASATTKHAATLQDAEIAIQGVGMSSRDLGGRLAIGQAAIAGQRLHALMARFELDPDRVRIPEFHVAVADGTVHGTASFSMGAPLDEMRVALSVHGLRPAHLFPATLQATVLQGMALDAEIAAAVSRGRVTATIDLPPTVTEPLRRLIHQPAHTASANTASGHLLLQAHGTLQRNTGVQASGSVVVRGLRALLTAGEPTDRELPMEVALAYRDGRLTLTPKALDFAAPELAPVLSRLTGQRILGREGRLVVSADATFGGSQPPAAIGAITLRGLSLGLARQETGPVPLLTGIQGSVAFTLERGLLTIQETALHAEGPLTVLVKGSVPFGGQGSGSPQLHLTVPWTDASVLRPTLAALTGGRPEDARIAGQLRADLELSGQAYHGTLSLRRVSLGSNLFHLDGADGVIPLHGRIGLGQTSPRDRPSAPWPVGWPRLSERAYQTARERLSNMPARAPSSLIIASLRYGPIELRDFEATLAPSGGAIAIQRFAFQAWGGRASGWGTVEPLGGAIALALLADGLSLRAICDAFPPITGYISGRMNGMADLTVPLFALDQAQGNARFWAVDSAQERRQISRTLIEALAGQRIRYFSLFGEDRRYDRGVLDVALRRGDLIFHELDISHTTMGFKDLDVRVSPAFNKIGLAHLLQSVSDALERVRASATPQPKQ